MVGPLLIALGIWVATEIGKALFDSFVADSVRASGIVGKTEAAIATGYLKNITAEALDGLCENEPHYNVGMSTDGLLNVFERFMRAVAQASVILTSEIAEELYTELIQEGFSNAIQMSVGGALQSILNVWRGSYPLNPEDIVDLISDVDKLDTDLIALLTAQAGANIPSTAWKLARGFSQYVDREHQGLRAQAEHSLNRINSLLAFPYEVADNIVINETLDALSLIKETYIKATSMIEEVAERALSRLNELKVELETVQKWIELTEQNPDLALIDPDSAYATAIENKAEAEATKNSYDWIKQQIESQLTNIDVDLTDLLSEVDTITSDVVAHYNNIIMKSIIDMTNEKDKILNAFKIVKAYRNAVDSSSSSKSSVTETYESGSSTEPPPIVQGSYLLVVTQTVSRLSAPSYNSLVTATQTITRLSAPSYNSLLVVVS